MSFKKFLAPVMSCCCAVSSLISPCKADGERKYKRDELLCYQVHAISNHRTSYDSIFVVGKKPGTEMPEKCKKCGKKLYGTGCIVGHRYGCLECGSSVDRNSQKAIIEQITNFTEKNFECMLCEDCAYPPNVAQFDMQHARLHGGNALRYRCPCCQNKGRNIDGDYIFKITKKEVPEDLWLDYGNYLIAGGVIFALLYGMLVTAALSENAKGTNRKKGVMVNRQNKYEYEKNNDNGYEEDDDNENDDDETNSEIYA